MASRRETQHANARRVDAPLLRPRADRLNRPLGVHQRLDRRRALRAAGSARTRNFRTIPVTPMLLSSATSSRLQVPGQNVEPPPGRSAPRLGCPCLSPADRRSAWRETLVIR